MNKLAFKRPATAASPPVKGLSAAATARWKALQAEYGIVDAGGLAILLLHCQAMDTAAAAQKIIDRDGVTITDRFGVQRSHPATVVLRDSRSQMLATLRALHLDVKPLHESTGRPLGGQEPA